MAFLIPVGEAIAGFFATAGPAITATAAIAGATSSVISATNKPKAPGMPTVPTAPDPNASLAQAQTDANNRRATLLATGGQTVYTSPTGATVNPGNLQLKTLLGN